jgi:hypothetical protein
MRSMPRLVLCLMVICACSKKEEPPPAPVVVPDAAPAANNKVQLPLAERPLGPTRAACEGLVAHMKTLILDRAPAPSQTAEQKAYAASLLKEFAPRGLAYCLQVAVPREVECLTAAKDAATLSSCERFRREIPPDLLERNEVQLSDCEHLYDRLRQFKIEEEGTSPAEIDPTRDQIIRSCVEKARVGTIVCFLASPTYEQARRCP